MPTGSFFQHVTRGLLTARVWLDDNEPGIVTYTFDGIYTIHGMDCGGETICTTGKDYDAALIAAVLAVGESDGE